MTYLRSDARNMGRYLRNTSAASLRDCRTAACSLFGLMWNTEERFSSSANCSAMIRRKRSDFRRPHTVMNATTEARQSTSVAWGGGSSASGKELISGTRFFSPIEDERALTHRGFAKLHYTQSEPRNAFCDNAPHTSAAPSTAAKVAHPQPGGA